LLYKKNREKNAQAGTSGWLGIKLLSLIENVGGEISSCGIDTREPGPSSKKERHWKQEPREIIRSSEKTESKITKTTEERDWGRMAEFSKERGERKR